MPTEMDLQQLERRTYLAYHQDGLADIAAGLILLMFGLGMALGEAMLTILAWMPFLLLWPFKRMLTYPRIGYVKYLPERRRKIQWGLVVMSVAGVFSLLLGVVAALAYSGQITGLQAWFRANALVVLGAILASGFILIAALFSIKRFFAYAPLVFAPWLLGRILNIDPGFLVVAAGGLILLAGLILLIRFMSRHPPIYVEANDG